MTTHHRGASHDLGDVPAAYDRAAGTYDTVVNLSPGYHRHLQSAADALVELLPSGPGLTLVDLGCGSGVSTDALVNSMGHRGEPYTAIGIDASAGMLAEAQSKSWPTWVSFVHGRAESLRALGETVPPLRSGVSTAGVAPVGVSMAGVAPAGVSMAGVLATHLFSCLADRDAALRSIWELLDPGGVLVVQEYTVAGSAPARARWNAMSWSMIIPLSKLVSRDATLPRRQWRTVLDNEAVDVFAGRMFDAGFIDVEHRTAGGWHRGMLHTFRARKPA